MRAIALMLIYWWLASNAFGQKVAITQSTMTLPARISSVESFVQIARWKDYYLLSYVDEAHTAHLLSTRDFQSYTSIRSYPNEYIWDIETKAGQIAILSSPVIMDQGTHRAYELDAKMLSNDGRVVKSVKVVGATDMGEPGATRLSNVGTTYIRWEKDAYVLYFTIERNHAKHYGQYDVHQAQTQYYMDKGCELLVRKSDWGVSHSFEQRIDVQPPFTLKVAKGDAYPRGIDFYIQHHDLIQNRVADYASSQVFHSVPMKIPGTSQYVELVLGDAYMDVEQKRVWITGAQWYQRPTADLFFLSQDFAGNEEPQLTWLTNTPQTVEHSVRMLPYQGDKYLLIWKEYDKDIIGESDYETLDEALYDAKDQGMIDIYQRLNQKQRIKAVLINPAKAKLIGEPFEINLDIQTIVKDMEQGEDYFYDLLDESYGCFWTDILIEDDRIVMPFFIQSGLSLVFYQIQR